MSLAARTQPLRACHHLGDDPAWAVKRPSACSCDDLIRCSECAHHHQYAHRDVARCGSCGTEFGPPDATLMGMPVVERFDIGWPVPFDHLEVTFSAWPGAVIEFDRVTITEVSTVCAGCYVSISRTFDDAQL